LAARPGWAVPPVRPRLRARAANTRRDLDTTARHPVPLTARPLCSQAGGRDRRSWRQRLERRAAPPAWSASLGGLILRYHPGWDAPPLTDRDAMVLRPGPDIAAELTARRGAGRPAKLSPPRLAGVPDQRGDLRPERGRALL